MFRLTKRSLFIQLFLTLFLLLSLDSPLKAAEKDTDIPDFLKHGKFEGNLRNYWQFRDIADEPDASGTSVGGRLSFYSGDFFKGFSTGLTYIFAEGFGLANGNLPLGDGTLKPDNTHFFGEAFLKYQHDKTEFKAGRILIDTPYANRAEGFMTPIGFTGIAITDETISNLKTTLFHFVEIKNRKTNDYRNIGGFTTNRLVGADKRENTAGMTTLGLDWHKDNVNAKFWNYYSYDTINIAYVDAEYTVKTENSYDPFMSAQYVRQDSVGDQLFGDVETNTVGGRLGLKSDKTIFSVAVNFTPQNLGTFRNGGYLTPYTLNTDPLYTVSMLEGLAVKRSANTGLSFKLSAERQFTDQIWVRFSYAGFDLHENVGGEDSSEYNFEVFYKFKGALKGLEIRNQSGYISSGLRAANLFEHRTQLQYDFSFDVF